MDICVLLILLIIVVALAIIVWANKRSKLIPIESAAIGIAGAATGLANNSTGIATGIKGGDDVPDILGNAELYNRLIISDNAKIVIDGNNMIHNITEQSNLKFFEFDNALRWISDILSKSLPDKDLHIVIKNPGNTSTNIFNEITKIDKLKKKPKGQKKNPEEDIPYFRKLMDISKLYPSITYHLAYGKESKQAKTEHHLKGRDDILTIYLAKNGYIVSLDRYRDFSKFKDIKPFNHFSVSNGTVFKKQKIIPKNIFGNLETPTVGNHIVYKFMNTKDLKKLGINSGDIHVDRTGEFSTLYLGI